MMNIIGLKQEVLNVVILANVVVKNVVLVLIQDMINFYKKLVVILLVFGVLIKFVVLTLTLEPHSTVMNKLIILDLVIYMLVLLLEVVIKMELNPTVVVVLIGIKKDYLFPLTQQLQDVKTPIITGKKE